MLLDLIVVLPYSQFCQLISNFGAALHPSPCASAAKLVLQCIRRARNTPSPSSCFSHFYSCSGRWVTHSPLIKRRTARTQGPSTSWLIVSSCRSAFGRKRGQPNRS